MISNNFKFASEAFANPFSLIHTGLKIKCEYEIENGDDHTQLHAFINLWMGLSSLSRVISAMEDCTFLSVAIGNEVHRAAKYIKENCGLDPLVDQNFTFVTKGV